jgi:hypothetical protein
VCGRSVWLVIVVSWAVWLVVVVSYCVWLVIVVSCSVWLVIVASCAVWLVVVLSYCVWLVIVVLCSVWSVVVASCSVWSVIVLSSSVWWISEFTGHIMSGPPELQVSMFLQIHPWVNFESLLQKCLVGQLVQSSRSAGSVSPRAVNKTTSFITKLFAKRGRTPCCAVCMRVGYYLSILIFSFQLAFTNVCFSILTTSIPHDNCGKPLGVQTGKNNIRQ